MSISRRRLMVSSGCAAVAPLFSGHAAAAVPARRLIRAQPHDYRELLSRLQPGDVLRLDAGVYERGLPIHELAGAPGFPIMIEGPSEIGQRAVILGQPGANTVSIADSAHVVIRHLTLDGRGLPVDAVKAEGHARWAHDITLEHLRIVNVSADQSIVGVSTKCPAWNWIVRGNFIAGAGTGMYFGDSDGSAPFFASVIERNHVVDPTGYAVQIKHQHARPQGAGAPPASSDTVIRHNVFVKRTGSAAADWARPSLLVGHFPLAGAGAQDRYLIYGNLLYDNPTEALFQGEGNVAVYSNLLVNPHGNAIRIQPHKHRPRAVAVFHNTVVAYGAGIELSGQEPGFPRFVERNLVFAKRPLPGDIAGRNLATDYERAADYLVQPFGPVDALDLSLRRAIANDEMRLPPDLASLPDVDRDYLGGLRGVGFGACASRGHRKAACR